MVKIVDMMITESNRADLSSVQDVERLDTLPIIALNLWCALNATRKAMLQEFV